MQIEDYFNAGVLLIDLDLVRSEKLFTKALNFVAVCPPSASGAETKQVIELTRSKLIVETSELRWNNRDVEAVKAMLSSIEDSARLSYGRETSHVPRQFVMIGTTSSSEYLVDATGNRRFWLVKVGRIDLKKLAADAPQLWAEAALREAGGAEIQLPEKLWSECAAPRRSRGGFWACTLKRNRPAATTPCGAFNSSAPQIPRRSRTHAPAPLPSRGGA